MTPGAFNLTIRRGTAFAITFTFTEDDGVTPVDLTGQVPYAQVRRLPNGALVEDLEPVLTSGPDGIVTISYTDAETLDLTPGVFRWDLVLKDTGNLRQGPYLAGLCEISTAITRSA